MTHLSKHTEPKRVGVIRGWSSHEAVMIVEDGSGFELGELNLGLVRMRERAALDGGSLEIDSQLGKRTTPVCSRDPR